MRDTRNYQVGDRVWHYSDALVSVVEIIGRRPFIDANGDHLFTSYTYRFLNVSSKYEYESVNGSEFWANPGERRALIEQIQDDIEHLQRRLNDLIEEDDAENARRELCGCDDKDAACLISDCDCAECHGGIEELAADDPASFAAVVGPDA